MDKKVLKEAMSLMVSGTEVEVVFNGGIAWENGSYKVVESKTGRGKGGSRTATLVSVTDSTRNSRLSTKFNEEVHSLVVKVSDTETLTFDSTVVTNKQPKNLERATELNSLFRTFKEGTRVSIVSPEVNFNGTFTVLSVL